LMHKKQTLLGVKTIEGLGVRLDYKFEPPAPEEERLG